MRFLTAFTQSPDGKLWAVDPNLEAAMSRVDAEANAIGGTIQPIADRLAALGASLASSMTAEEQAAAATRVSADADALSIAGAALTALGQSPTNPVPVPVAQRSRK